MRLADGTGFSASIVDADAVRRQQPRSGCGERGASLVLYLPKIQTAEEAALWNDILSALEQHLALPAGAIKVYVLVEQIEACFQLMEIRAALGPHFVGFNTGRWDYINSVSDAMAWDPDFVNPNIDAITMTYGYMRNYEDRVRRAVNTPDRAGRFALWQGGMEPNIPVGSDAGVAAGMKRAVAGAEREQREGASGKWVAHWKMVHIVRPVWEKAGQANQLGRAFPPLTYTGADADGLMLLEPAPRTDPRRPRSAERRPAVRQRVRPGPAGRRAQAGRLLRQRRRALPDGRHGDRRDPPEHPVGVAAQGRALTADDEATGAKAGDRFTPSSSTRLLDEEYDKLLARGQSRRARRLEDTPRCPSRARSSRPTSPTPLKLPWYIDLLNINLDNHDLAEARAAHRAPGRGLRARRHADHGEPGLEGVVRVEPGDLVMLVIWRSV